LEIIERNLESTPFPEIAQIAVAAGMVFIGLLQAGVLARPKVIKVYKPRRWTSDAAKR